jgi:hypothetical protein
LCDDEDAAQHRIDRRRRFRELRAHAIGSL